MHDSSANIQSISLVKSLVYRFSNVSLDSKTIPAKATPDKWLRSVSTTAGGTDGHRNTFLYAATMTSGDIKRHQNKYNSGISSNSGNGDSDYEKPIEKIDHLMKELCDTEQNYITTLTDAQMYLNYLQMTMVTNSPDVREMENYVNDIIKQHRDFHMDLNLIYNYIQPTESIGRLFLKYKSDLFDLYPELTKYKVRLEQVLCQEGVKDLLLIKYKEFDDKLGFPFPHHVLPKEYGGEAPSCAEIAAFWKKKVESYRDWFLEDDKYGTDERRRPGNPKTTENVFGLEGSFRKLNVD